MVEIRDMGLKYHILGSTCHLVLNKVNTTQRVVFHVIKLWSHGLHKSLRLYSDITRTTRIKAYGLAPGH